MESAAWVTAGATIVLVVVTICYVVLTNRISRAAVDSAASARASAAQAARAADTAERALIAEGMPLLIVRLSSDVRGDRWVIQNVGRATALNIVVFGDDSAFPYPPIDGGDSGSMTATKMNGEVTIEYDDALGNRYKTVSSLSVRMDGRMFQTSIKSGDGWDRVVAFRRSAD